MYQVQKQKGITLIALVITVIVLIILAGVAINLTVGENGILTKAKQAKTDYNLAKEREELELEIANIQIEIMSQENRAATLNDLYARIDKSKYAIELKFDPVATLAANVNSTPTYSIVNKIGSMYYFTVDSKLVITDVETREPKVSYITFSDITWNSGKASITLSTKEQGTIEYKVGEDGVYAPGTTIENLSHGDTVYARINNNGEYTEEETKVIYDGIKPEDFTVTTSDLTYNSVKLTTTGTTDNQTGLASYTYVAENNGNIVQEIPNQTVKEYPITGLEEQTEYVVYMLAYDNAGNVRKSNEVTVKTEAMPVAKLFGQYVNYIDLDDDATTPDWQVFYKEDGELNPDYEGATYIIPKYYVPYSKMTTSIANAGMSLYSGTTYRVYWPSVPSSYVKMNNYDTIKQIFMYDYTGESNENVKCVSTLLYTDYWKDDFVTPQLQSKGGMAIGGPTINMWCASWNKAYPTETITPTIGEKGYQIKGYNQSTSTNELSISVYTGYTSAPNVYFPTNKRENDATLGYLTASPINYGTVETDTRYLAKIHCWSGNIDYMEYNDRDSHVALRPLVYLPKEVKLEPSGTANVWNINYGN